MMTRARLAALLPAYRGLRVMVVGDVMLDRFIRGNVSRISPEAPVPVVHVTREDAYPGGAANVARNLAPFAKSVSVLGVTGTCALTAQLRDLLAASQIDTAGLIASPAHETIVKTRVIARSQQVARIDRETLRSPAPDVVAAAEAWLAAQLPQTDAVIIEDYAKGFLTQAMVDLVVTGAKARGLPIMVDPNPGNPLAWRGVTVIKPNRKEAYAAADLPDPGEVPLADLLASVESLGQRLFEKWETRYLLITLGEHGMALLEKGQRVYHTPTRAQEVFDVSGAGDTAIAHFTLALASGASPTEAAELANLASGIVVGKIGTAAVTPDELRVGVDKESV
jgi:D-glycero-beta-D-manno-heptose-7-phosphate kinase